MKRWIGIALILATACSDQAATKRTGDAGAMPTPDAASGNPLDAMTMHVANDASPVDAFDASADDARAGTGGDSDQSPAGAGGSKAEPHAGAGGSATDRGFDAAIGDAGADAGDSQNDDGGDDRDAAVWANVIAAENAKPGSTSWQNSRPATAHEIEGYASVTSVNLGESLELYVNTSASSYQLEIYRLGWYAGAGARLMVPARTQAGIVQAMPVPDADGLVECHWTQPITIATHPDWVSGVYLAKLTESAAGKQAYIPFVVRDDARGADILFQSSVTTFQAYNNWGGKSLYDFNSDGTTRASKVSFHRPYGPGLNSEAAAGVGAGEILTTFQSKAQSAAAAWEYSMIRFLEREGLDVSYVTSVDTHRNAELLRSHRAFLSVGHDEYWSWEMRRTVEDGRDRFGTSVGFFSGNDAYWQIRFEPETGPDAFSRIVCYKDAPPGDPWLGTADAYRSTVRWSTPPLSRPEAALHRLTLEDLGIGVDVDLVVEDPEHWIYAGTGLAKGDHIAGLVGYEVDGLAANPSPGVLRFAHSPWTSGQNSGAADMVSFATPSGAQVVAVGSIQFAWGLDDFRVAGVVGAAPVSAAAQTMVRNALARFTAPRADATHSPIVVDETFAAPRDASLWRLGSMSEGSAAYDPAVGISLGGQRLQINPLAATAGLHHAGYVSARAFDLSDASVRVEVLQTTDAASAADTTFAIGIDSANCYRFTFESGTLVMQHKSGGAVTSQNVAYDAVADRWWRIRHSSATNAIYWETSPDGANWTTRHNETVTLSPAALYIEVEAGTYQAESSPGIASFDNLQVELLGLTDSFSGSRNPEHFTPDVLHLGDAAFDPQLIVFTFTGQLHIRPLSSALGEHFGGYATTRAFDFTGARTSVEVVQVAAGNAQTVFAITQSTTDYARIVAQAASLSFQRSVGGLLTSVTVAYDASAQRFWRIRHDGAADQLVWETSPDGSTWNEQRRTAAQTAMAAVRAEILAGTSAAEAAPGEALIDNFVFTR